MKFDLIRRIIWITGISLALILNFVCGQPHIYKGQAHPVGTNVVSVHHYENRSGQIPVPVTMWSKSDSRFVETGETVTVYVRNSYNDHTPVPRATFFILAVTLLLQFALALAKGWKSSPLVLEFREALPLGFFCTIYAGLSIPLAIWITPMVFVAGILLIPGCLFITNDLGAFTLPIGFVWTFVIDWILMSFCIVGVKRLRRRLKTTRLE